MKTEQNSTDGGFSLFDQEEQVLQSAASMIGKLEDVAGGVRELADAYRQSYREQSRLLRISDRLQLDLHQANQTLASQAEDLKRLNHALRTEIGLREALAEQLQWLNENLEQQVREQVAKSREQECLLVQQSRHAALGEMIGNIAHQWRQPLFSLSLIMQTIEHEHRSRMLDDAILKEHVASAGRVIEQMNGTVDDFLDFFKPHKTPEAFSLMEAVDSALNLVQKSMGFKIRVLREEGGEVRVGGYANELSQVLINILSNARDVLAEREIDGGEVVIGFGGDGAFAWIDIRDNAGGIPEENLDKIFTPYFTTKEKGTGIGLYMSQVIMKNMGGAIAVRNLEHGAEFRLMLPRSV